MEHSEELVSHVFSIIMHQLMELFLAQVEDFLCWRAIIEHQLGLLVVDHHDGQDGRQRTFNLQQTL